MRDGVATLLRSSLVRPSLARFEVARFDLISTRNVSEGRIYVACDAFPHLSLAHASGYDNPWQKLTASNRDCRKRNFKAHASRYEKSRHSSFLLAPDSQEQIYDGQASTWFSDKLFFPICVHPRMHHGLRNCWSERSLITHSHKLL